MTEWINVFWNNSLVNPMRLHFLCEKTGALAIVELGLTADRQVGRLFGRQNCCKVRKFKFCIFDF